MNHFSLRSWDRFDHTVGFSSDLSGAPTSLASPNWLIHFLHSFPHFKRDFSLANSSFTPESDEYRESVVILLAFPILWLLLTLLIFLIYFCVRCFQACCKKRNEEKSVDDETQGRGANCCRHFWLIAIVFIGVVSLGVGLYGNEEVSSGSRSLLVSVRQLGHRVLAAKAKVETTTHDAKDREDAIIYINSILGKLDGTRAPREERKRIKEHLTALRKDMKTKHNELAKLDQLLNNDFSPERYMNEMRKLRSGEDLRWIATAVFFCWTIFILLLLIIGLARKSKCCLFVFAAFATITLVICWTVVSAYLGVAVGVADLCVDTRAFVHNYGGYVHEKNFNRFHFILNCSHATPNGNRYMNELRTVTASIHNAKNHMDDLDKRVKQYMTSRNDRKQIPPLVAAIQQRLNLDADSARVMSATALLECQINQHLLFDAVHGLCFNGINGIALVLLGATVLGLCFTILILIASCSWRKFRPEDNYIPDADHENDPFLSGNYTTGPHYMSRRHHTESPEPVSHHHHAGRSRHNKQTTVADVSVASSAGSTAAPRPAPAASNPTYSEHPIGATGPCGTPPLNSFSGSRTPPPPYGHSSSHHGSHHDSIYPSAPVL